MSEIPPTPEPAGNIPVYTVSELSGALKRSIEDRFGRVRVRAEVSGFKRAASGHLYFTLKDADAILASVCWRGMAAKLAVQPEDGLEIICSGRLTTYPGRSQYQLIVDSVELAGEGALLKLLEERRKALVAEGLFDAARKLPLPYLPRVLGVVTSPTGAVIRDILHRIAERFPRHVLVWPVVVQGERAAGEIAAAIEGFNRLDPAGAVPRPELLIVARGGGSLEDLWAFNEEAVVRAAAASAIPLISAVGHETDTTLIDFAADQRAPTPSAAAEMAVPVRAELIETVRAADVRLLGAINRRLEADRSELRGLARGLPDPASLLDVVAQRLDDRVERLVNAAATELERRAGRLDALARGLRHPREPLKEREARIIAAGRALRAGMRARLAAALDRHGRRTDWLDGLALRLGRAMTSALEARRRELAARARLLDGFSYQKVLERGFVLVRDEAGAALVSVAATAPDMAVCLRFADGEAGARITDGAPRPAPRPAKPPRKKKPTGPDPGQGELL